VLVDVFLGPDEHPCCPPRTGRREIGPPLVDDPTGHSPRARPHGTVDDPWASSSSPNVSLSAE
jgi:hypothetical protein